MPRYHQHRKTGALWWVALACGVLYGHAAWGLSQAESLLVVAIGLPAALLGAVVPDVDLASSIAHRRLRLALLLAATVATFLLLQQPAVVAFAGEAALLITSVPLAPQLALTLLAVLVGLACVALLGLCLPRHRGITHRVWFALFTGAIIGFVSYSGVAAANFGTRSSLVVAAATAGFYFAGYLSHLLRDGVLTIRRRRRAC